MNARDDGDGTEDDLPGFGDGVVASLFWDRRNPFKLHLHLLLPSKILEWKLLLYNTNIFFLILINSDKLYTVQPFDYVLLMILFNFNYNLILRESI
ncbi:hypothetical protein IEQ34_005985 [Dendrobium chrysotoxum]|uniref:Transmembrane protein n=1 Tax=Dendrobium chrysotoxum TaxID=161865 RepID=A0AAV7HAF6_DENCH|nr:hypothetical protein IEQ34_005985 [Dendrobium chrysotoxum]